MAQRSRTPEEIGGVEPGFKKRKKNRFAGNVVFPQGFEGYHFFGDYLSTSDLLLTESEKRFLANYGQSLNDVWGGKWEYGICHTEYESKIHVGGLMSICKISDRVFRPLQSVIRSVNDGMFTFINDSFITTTHDPFPFSPEGQQLLADFFKDVDKMDCKKIIGYNFENDGKTSSWQFASIVVSLNALLWMSLGQKELADDLMLKFVRAAKTFRGE